MRKTICLIFIMILTSLLVGCSYFGYSTGNQTEVTIPPPTMVAPMEFYMGPNIQEILGSPSVRALFENIPPESEWSPDIFIVCSDFHKLTEVLRSLGFSEEFIRGVFNESSM